MSDGAKSAIIAHADAVNARDRNRYIESTSFPFTYQNYNGVAITVNTPEEYGESAPLPWEIIDQTDPQWSHSQFEPLEIVVRSKTSAVYKVSFRRVDKAGTASALYDAIWIASQMDGKWGVQFRHNLGLRLDCN